MRKNLLLLAASLFIGLLFVEGTLRIAGVGFPLFTKVDGETGFALRPGAEGWQTDEGRAYVEINADGFRDRLHAKEKPDGVFRIAVLGDSYAEARQVDVGETFWAIAEKELQSCPARNGRMIEVMNFGTSGFGTTQELLQLRSRVWSYEPDLILLLFTSGNDVRNNSFALEQSTQKPYFHLKDGTWTLDTSFRETPFFRSQQSRKTKILHSIYQHSRILQLLRRAHTAWGQRKTPKGDATASVGAETGIDAEIYRPPSSPEWKEAWEITERVLTMMQDEAAARGTRFILVTGSNALQVDPDVRRRAASAKEIGVTNLLLPEHRLTTLGKREGFPVLTLAEPLQKIAEAEGVFLHGFEKSGLGSGHWNEKGHKEAARLLTEFLCTSHIPL